MYQEKHNAMTLRRLLEELAQIPVTTRMTQQDAAELFESFRDCQLELARLQSMRFSDDQAHRIRQMGYRLEMAAQRQALPESIPGEAQKALAAFGWTSGPEKPNAPSTTTTSNLIALRTGCGDVGEAMKTRIMYIECKSGGLSGPARIGRVSFSKTGRTIYYDGKTFKSLKGRGFKANYYEEASGDYYWISGPRRDGTDRLYGESSPVEIDPDVREEYWCKIRSQPDRAAQAAI